MNNYQIGDRIGKLCIKSFSNTKSSRPSITAICKCECGKIVERTLSQLKKTRSCGCTWHHKSNTKVYWAWVNMKSRCLDLNDKEYWNYGGRGIKVCEGLRSFNNFYKTIGDPPSCNHSNDRIDNEGNYSCGECHECKINKWDKNIKWSTLTEQLQNKRNNVTISLNGIKTCLSQVSREINIPQSTLWMRIFKYKWTIEKSISTPLKTKTSC